MVLQDKCPPAGRLTGPRHGSCRRETGFGRGRQTSPGARSTQGESMPMWLGTMSEARRMPLAPARPLQVLQGGVAPQIGGDLVAVQGIGRGQGLGIAAFLLDAPRSRAALPDADQPEPGKTPAASGPTLRPGFCPGWRWAGRTSCPAGPTRHRPSWPSAPGAASTRGRGRSAPRLLRRRRPLSAPGSKTAVGPGPEKNFFSSSRIRSRPAQQPLQEFSQQQAPFFTDILQLPGQRIGKSQRRRSQHAIRFWLSGPNRRLA